MTQPPTDRGLLAAGDAILMIDRKERTYLRTLKAGGKVTVRGAPIPADQLIGLPEGSTIIAPSGERFLLLRPTYAQLIPSLPRQAQPIYPKDVGPMLLWGDIAAGHRVIEIGVGPGAVTLALLRAVGPTGFLYSYELREDFAARAKDNVARFHGDAPNWTVHVGDATTGLVERNVDRAVVDLAEPWTALDALVEAVRPGGVVTAFVPTALQVKETVDGFRSHGGFGVVDTLETLARYWHVKERSVRPQHRMVAHTGFLVFARRLPSGEPVRCELTPSEPRSTELMTAEVTAEPASHDESGGPPEDLADD